MNEEFLKAQLEDLAGDFDLSIENYGRDYAQASAEFDRASTEDNLPVRILAAGRMQYYSGAKDAYIRAKNLLADIIEKVWE